MGVVKSGTPPDEKVLVDKVLRNSAADRAGVQVDMRMISVNGKSLSQLSKGEFQQLLSERPLTAAFKFDD